MTRTIAMTQSGPWRSYQRRQTWKLTTIQNKNFNKSLYKILYERVNLCLEELEKCLVKISKAGDFPGSSVIKILHFQCRGYGFDPWLRNWDPTCHTVGPIKNKNKPKKKKEKYISKTKSIWDKLQAKWGFLHIWWTRKVSCISGGQGWSSSSKSMGP